MSWTSQPCPSSKFLRYRGGTRQQVRGQQGRGGAGARSPSAALPCRPATALPAQLRRRPSPRPSPLRRIAAPTPRALSRNPVPVCHEVWLVRVDSRGIKPAPAPGHALTRQVGTHAVLNLSDRRASPRSAGQGQGMEGMGAEQAQGPARSRRAGGQALAAEQRAPRRGERARGAVPAPAPGCGPWTRLASRRLNRKSLGCGRRRRQVGRGGRRQAHARARQLVGRAARGGKQSRRRAEPEGPPHLPYSWSHPAWVSPAAPAGRRRQAGG